MPSSRKKSRRRRATPARAGAGKRKSDAPRARKPAGPGARGKARRRGAGAARPSTAGRGTAARRGPAPPPVPEAALEGATDPAGFFVARVCGEDAVRGAPHPMAEGATDTGNRIAEGVARVPAYDEGLGELPWGYGDDAVVALPRDPRSLFLYWDHAASTLQRGFDGLDHPRAQLWLYARAEAGWERVRVLDVALESRGFYVHDLDPGQTYRGELRAADGAGRDRLLGPPSNEISLPPSGPSPVIDDRFVRLSWDQPLGGALGPGHRIPGFAEESREALARLSDWSRAGHSLGGSAGLGGPAAGGKGGRPTSPGAGGEGER